MEKVEQLGSPREWKKGKSEGQSKKIPEKEFDGQYRTLELEASERKKTDGKWKVHHSLHHGVKTNPVNHKYF